MLHTDGDYQKSESQKGKAYMFSPLTETELVDNSEDEEPFTENSAERTWHLFPTLKDWGHAIQFQSYGNAIYASLAGPCLALVSLLGKPAERPSIAVNPAISMASKTALIPEGLVLAVPLLAFIGTVMVGEFGIFKAYHLHQWKALATTIHFSVDAICCLTSTMLLQQVTALMAGRLRPDFAQLSQAGGGDANAGRPSFPPYGITAAFLLAAYTAYYFLWIVYFRKRSYSIFGNREGFVGSIMGWLVFEFGHLMVLLWCVACFAFAWFVGVQRCVDTQSPISDMLGALLLGAFMACLFAAKAIGMQAYVTLERARPYWSDPPLGIPGSVNPATAATVANKYRPQGSGTMRPPRSGPSFIRRSSLGAVSTGSESRSWVVREAELEADEEEALRPRDLSERVTDSFSKAGKNVISMPGKAVEGLAEGGERVFKGVGRGVGMVGDGIAKGANVVADRVEKVVDIPIAMGRKIRGALIKVDQLGGGSTV